MTILSTLRALTFLASDARNAAHSLVQQAFTAAVADRTAQALDLSGLAERLAEREAGEEVGEPAAAPYMCPVSVQPGDRVAVQLNDGSMVSGVYDPSIPGRIDTDPERWNEASRRDAFNMPQPVGTFEDPEEFVIRSSEPAEAQDLGPSWPESETPLTRAEVLGPHETPEYYGGTESTGPARNEEALELLRTDPEAFFEQTRRQIPSAESIFRSGGQTKEFGPRPKPSAPRWSTKSRTDSQRLDRIIELLEVLTNLPGANGGEHAPVVPPAVASLGGASEYPAGAGQAPTSAAPGTASPDAAAETPPRSPIPIDGTGVGLTPGEVHRDALTRAMEQDRNYKGDN